MQCVLLSRLTAAAGYTVVLAGAGWCASQGRCCSLVPDEIMPTGQGGLALTRSPSRNGAATLFAHLQIYTDFSAKGFNGKLLAHPETPYVNNVDEQP